MAIWKRPDLPPGSLRELNDLLHRLRERSGFSSRQIAAAIRRQHGTAPSHTTIHQLFTLPKLPRADVVLRVAEVLAAAQPGSPTDDDRLLDLVDRLWQQAAHHQQPQPPAEQPLARQPTIEVARRRRARVAAPPSWQLMTSASSTPTSVLRHVTAVDSTHAWAVGIDSYAPDEPGSRGVPIIDRWDGTRWSRVPLPDVTWCGGLDLVAADSATNVIAVGASSGPDPSDNVTRVLHYDGSTWHDVPFPLDNPDNTQQISGLTCVGGRAWLVGNNRGKALILEWDGQSWHEHQPPPECEARWFGDIPIFGNILAVTAFAPNDIWACGNGFMPGFTGPLLFHWNGANWRTVFPGIDQEAALHAITGRSSEDLWAIGNSVFAPARSLVLHADTESWQTFELPPVKLDGITQDTAGRPWIIGNSAASASLATYDPNTDTWTHTIAPRPPGTVGLTLYGITAVPGTSTMLAVGAADLPTTPRTLQAVILEHRGI